jgi:hypothetical protein
MSHNYHRRLRDEVSLREHLAALREADKRFYDERDRRYAEVSIEKEKALKIKEIADLTALQLAREIQTYKDGQHNNLRDQINSERGLYPTKGDLQALSEKFEAAQKPVIEFMASFQGHSTRGTEDRQQTNWIITTVIAAGVAVVALVALFLRK